MVNVVKRSRCSPTAPRRHLGDWGEAWGPPVRTGGVFLSFTFLSTEGTPQPEPAASDPGVEVAHPSLLLALALAHGSQVLGR